MNLNKTYVLNAFMQTPWAIMLSKLAALEEIVQRHVSGERLSAEEVQARLQGVAARPADRQVKTVAVLPLFGTIIPRADFFSEASGATSAEKFSNKFMQLVKDPSIDAIVIDVNSPGGQVGGIQEASQRIFDARGTKPIIAVANQLMASAAYWIGTAADQLVVTPSGEVGSIGVFAVHQDVSQALQQEGVTLSIISAGKYKVEGNPYQPLTEEARASIQQGVNDFYDAFVNDVARNRGVSVDAVRNGYGEGRTVGAQQAVELGMADRVATLDEVINDLLNPNTAPASTSASVSENLKLSEQVLAFNTPKDEARARLESAGHKKFDQGDSKMLRELLSQRETKLARAQSLWDAADKDGREFTEAEKAEFEQLLGAGEATGEIGELDAKIEDLQNKREKLRSAADRKFNAVDPQKPAEASDSNVMKRAEFEKLAPTSQAAFVKAGGKIQD